MRPWHCEDRLGTWPQRGERRHRLECWTGDLLDFERDDVAVARQLGRGIGIIEACGDGARRDGTGRAVGIGVEDLDVVA